MKNTETFLYGVQYIRSYEQRRLPESRSHRNSSSEAASLDTDYLRLRGMFKFQKNHEFTMSTIYFSAEFNWNTQRVEVRTISSNFEF